MSNLNRDERLQTLTDTEREIVELILLYPMLDNREIAEIQGCAVQTLKNHMGAIYNKLIPETIYNRCHFSKLRLYIILKYEKQFRGMSDDWHRFLIDPMFIKMEDAMSSFDCYRQTVEDAYAKLLKHESYFSGIADSIEIEGWRIAFRFGSGTYHLSPHSINCNSISDVRDALLRVEPYYRDGSAKKIKGTTPKKRVNYLTRSSGVWDGKATDES